MVRPCKLEKPNSELEYWEQRQYIYAASMLYLQEKYGLSYAEARIYLSVEREEFMGAYEAYLGLGGEYTDIIKEKLEKKVPEGALDNTAFRHNYIYYTWDVRDPRVF